MLELRRAEVIAIGAFPFMFMFSGLGYDYYYYFQSGMNANYVPWPGGPGTSKWTSTNNSQQLEDKYKTLVLTSIGLSITLAALDWMLGKAGVQ